MKKIFITIMLLFVVSLTFLIAEIQGIPSMVNYRNTHLKKPTHNYQLIQEYEFEKPLSTIYFIPATLHNSGYVSLAQLDENGPGEIYSFDENMNKKYLGKLVVCPYSWYGKYFFVNKRINDNQVEHKLMDNVGNIHDTIIENTRKYSDESEFLIWRVNDNGDFLLLYSNETYEIHYHNGIIKKLLEIKYDKQTDFYYCKSTTAISNNGNFAICAGDNNEDKKKRYYSFPSGSRVFFYDKKGDFVTSYDIEGTDMSMIARYSNNGRYFVMQNSGVMYVFRDAELVFKKDVKGLGYIYFSPDESLVLLGTGLGSLIMELPSCKVIDNFSIVGSAKAIANKGFPYVACAEENELYVVNYQTGEVLLSEIIRPDYPRYISINRVQLSGDGKTLTAFHYEWYRKYKIGEKR